MSYLKKIFDLARLPIFNKKGIYHNVIEHDDWCKFLKTNVATECNCNPNIHTYDEKTYIEKFPNSTYSKARRSEK